jgi:hypothetical protein
MRTGRPIAPLSLEVEERETLEDWARVPHLNGNSSLRGALAMLCEATDKRRASCSRHPKPFAAPANHAGA